MLLPLTTFLSAQKAAGEVLDSTTLSPRCCSQRWPEGIWVTHPATASVTAVLPVSYVYLPSTLTPFRVSDLAQVQVGPQRSRVLPVSSAVPPG